jgi:hypothetical protein
VAASRHFETGLVSTEVLHTVQNTEKRVLLCVVLCLASWFEALLGIVLRHGDFASSRTSTAKFVHAYVNTSHACNLHDNMSLLHFAVLIGVFSYIRNFT